ncbi:hypothetical protein ACFLZ8_01705 [Planctomycetota bacterium]
MSVLVGIDEAGFGPILGPLVVSSSSFFVSGDFLQTDLWQVLRKSIGDKRRQLSGRLLITDSKKAYNKSTGIKHLERTVISVMRILGMEPSMLSDLVEYLCPDSFGRLKKYPWYHDVEDSRLSHDVADIKIASHVLSNDLNSNNMKVLDVRSCCLDVQYYNRLVDAVKNKANVLFTATSQLIQRAYDNYAGEDLHIIIDRQGGRTHYRNNLQLMFPHMRLTILSENPTVSSYELATNKGAMRLHFKVGADIKYLPVSLASMISKYLRELLIDSINRYFAGFNPDLRPTAGYWKDGLRFIEDLRTVIPHVKYSNEQLIRSR